MIASQNHRTGVLSSLLYLYRTSYIRIGRAEAGAAAPEANGIPGIPDGFDGFHCKGLHGGPNHTPILFPTTPVS
jgi:hypothetical protein